MYSKNYSKLAFRAPTEPHSFPLGATIIRDTHFILCEFVYSKSICYRIILDLAALRLTNHMSSCKEYKDIREPNKVKSVKPVIFHFLMFKVRNAGCE